MTVLSFADTRFPIERANGVQTMATCQALAARGHDVTLVVRPDTAEVSRDPFAFYGVPPTSRLRIQVVPAVGARWASRVRFLSTAVWMSAQRADAVVYTRDLGLAAMLLGPMSIRRAPVVYESHGLAPVVSEEMPRLLGKPALAPSPSKVRRLDRHERRVWAQAAAYVTITQALAGELISRYGSRERVFVIPDGAPPADAAESAIELRPGADTSQRLVAAYAGHLYPWKGADIFIRALALAPDVDGLIVGGHPGEPDLARVTALARELGVSGRLEITGMVPPGEVARRLARASFLVLPNTASAMSERYTSPLKLFEYLRLGRAIVASDLAAVREVLTHERTALLVPPGDAPALAGALQRLARDRALSAGLGGAAREHAANFTWAARASRLEGAFQAARL